jgi:multiple sugar transport system substrate-binding protein
VHELIYLNKAAKGSVRQIGLEHVMSVYTIWQFAENKEGAQKFLIDLVNNFEQAFMASEFYNFPCFEKTVPNLQAALKKDSKAIPADKYTVLSDVTKWATNIGYPGYCNAAIGEAWDTWVLNTMFAQAATGAETPEYALNMANTQYQRIYNKYKERKLI